TLLFEPEHRFPMATSYSVDVPAGVKSAVGESLKSDKRWSFATPAPTVKTSYPDSGPRRRDQIMFVEFDQKVDPASVLNKIRVGSGRSNVNIRLATQVEIDQDEEISRLAKSAQEGRWLAFRATSDAPDGTSLALPGDSQITVSIGQGTPSLEGPLVTTAPQTFGFPTFGPLKVEEARCGYDGCRPMQPWSIRFNNPLDEAGFQQSQVRVQPEVPGMKIQIFGNNMVINGLTRGRTIYHVTLDRSIKDQFDQTLGKDAVETFDVQSAEPSLAAAKSGLVVLDPYGPARYSVFSINYPTLKTSLYAVGPEDWDAFLTYLRNRQQFGDQSSRPVPPGRLAFSKDIAVGGEPDQMAETAIDLSPALANGHGQVVVVIEPPGPANPRNRYRQMPVISWVQATGIGLDAFVDGSDLIGWATSLKDGKPLEGVQLSLSRSGGKSSSGSDGLVHLPLPGLAVKTGTEVLVARKGTDLAILPESTYWWGQNSSWFRKPSQDFLRWYVFDDRGMYKPGEEVRIKGWIRLVGGGKDGDIGPLGGAAREVSYSVKDSRGNEVAKGSVSPNALGGFDTRFKLPDAMNLGYARVELKTLDAATALGGRDFTHAFQVQEFRRPEFEVSTSASEGPHMIGGHADVTVKAAYYAGGGLPNAQVNWTVTASPGYFTPPNRGDFTFGEWIPWWINRGGDSLTRTETFSGETDSSGKHVLRIDFDSVEPARAMSVHAEASVMDVNRQAWNSSATLLVHPADLYVGLRSPRTFVQPGEPLIVQSIVTDIDGKAIPGREIRMRAVLLDWTYKNGNWIQEEKDPQECTVKSGPDAVECRFQPKQGGTYRVTATIMDDKERRNQSSLTLWVAGGKTPPKRDVEQEEAPLIPDRKDYHPGETAEILVQSPFFPAEGVLTLRRSGVVSTERFTMTGPSYTLKVPIKESYIPNIEVEVDLNGAADRATDIESGLTPDKAKQLPKRPGFAVGTLSLSVPPLSRRLAVTATPADAKLEPGGETTVEVQVKDAAGGAVAGGELAVVVVDESILALSSYKMTDPLEVFYSNRGADTNDYHSRQEVLLASSTDLLSRVQGGVQGGGGGRATGIQSGIGGVAQAEFGAGNAMPVPAPMMARALKQPAQGQGGNEATQGIQIRENFNALATFASTVPTDQNGRATVKVKVPDSLTRYRIMAVAVAGGKEFGYGESAITARLPLMVRPSPPRFLNFGDKFELPIVVQNQTDSPMDVSLAVRAANAQLTDGSGRKVTVPANDRVEVRVPAAAVRPGTARFQIAAASGRWDDAAEVEFPVWTPATTEAFATYGEIDNGAMAQPVQAPTNVVQQFGGLEVTTSSTQLQALTDAFIYLVAYPFECAEQLSSRILAVAALRDVLTAFNAKGLPKPEEMTAAVARDITRLRSMQNDDGGFGFWRRGDNDWPYLGIHVAHALE
ncbi:MAG TPA: alpha-2-macroglobulin family protein, partial [Blastocatellia bacterium]|nr:alpha-2-macroglobulin family protein [Blastocatellia bacterium]